MYIILTDIANITPFIVPIVPPNVEIDSDGNNTEQNTLNGQINIIDFPKLRTITWSSIFPVNKKYNFVNAGAIPNGWSYVIFLETMKNFRLPIRIIITTKNKIPILNTLATIDKFERHIDKAGDINYTIQLKEFPEGFFDFVERDKKVYKYIKGYLKSSNKLEILKKFGLMVANRKY